MIREIAAERAGRGTHLQGCQEFQDLQALGKLSPFEAEMATRTIRLFREGDDYYENPNRPISLTPTITPAETRTAQRRQAEINAQARLNQPTSTDSPSTESTK
jgi:hypothetical protein